MARENRPLFRVITGDLASESGTVTIPKHARIGQVAQEAPGTEDSLISIVLAADKERAALLQESETATDPNRIADIQMRLVDIDAHSAEARASAILAGLGFDQEAQLRTASSFSGGWRMRVALASFSSPSRIFCCSTSRRTISILKVRCGLKIIFAAIPHRDHHQPRP